MTRVRDIAGLPRHLSGWRPGGRPPHGAPAMRMSVSERLGPLRCVLKDVDKLRIENQGYLGTCVAQTATSGGEYLARQLLGESVQFSSLALYAWVREYAGTPLSEDSGSFNNTAAKVLAEKGFPLDSQWPYNVAKWDQLPPPLVELGASAHKLGMHLICPNIATIEASIQQDKPVTVGFECFESLDSRMVSDSGYVPFAPEEKVIGGHAVLIVGYDRATAVFYFLNSWGTDWGLKLDETATRGFGALPYEYVSRGYATETISYRTITPLLEVTP